MNRIRIACGVAVLASLLISISAKAGPYGDSLAKCLVSATTATEKTTLIRWIFATVALHPQVQAYTSFTQEQRDQLNKNTARVFERLLTDSCGKETLEAVKYEGANTIENAFSLLGQVAMRELFTDPKVAAGMEGFAKELDQEKLKKVLAPTQ